MKKTLFLFLLLTSLSTVNGQELRKKFLFSGNFKVGVFSESGLFFGTLGDHRIDNETSYGNLSVGYFATESSLFKLDYFHYRFDREPKHEQNSLSSVFFIEKQVANYFSFTFSQSFSRQSFRFILNAEIIAGKTKSNLPNPFSSENKANVALYTGLGFRKIRKNHQLIEYGLDIRVLEINSSSSHLRGQVPFTLYFRPAIVYNPNSFDDKEIESYPLVSGSKLNISVETGDRSAVQLLAYHNFKSNRFRIGGGYSIVEEFNGESRRNPFTFDGYWLLHSQLNFLNINKERGLLPYLRLRYDFKRETLNWSKPLRSNRSNHTLALQAVQAKRNFPLQMYYGLGYVQYFDSLFGSADRNKTYRQMTIDAGLEYYLTSNCSFSYDMKFLLLGLDELFVEYNTYIPNFSSQFKFNIYL